MKKQSVEVKNSPEEQRDRDSADFVPRSEPTGSGPRSSRIGRFAGRFLLPPVKVTAYAAFVVVAVALALVGADKLAELSLRNGFLSQVYPHDFSKVRLDYTRPVSHYDYDLTPGVCIQYNTGKGNRYEYANNAGFREPADIPLKKPDDEYRVFLVGGSTAFGLGSTGAAADVTAGYFLEYRETISHMMEMILNADPPIPGKKIRVYNTAVWGYAYQHHLGRYLAKLRRYKPDLVISLDGANEVGPVTQTQDDWQYFREGQYNGILRQIFAYHRPGLASYVTLWLKNNTFMMTLLWQGRDLFQELNAQAHVTSPGAQGRQGALAEEKERRLVRNVGTVVRMIENYHSMLDNDRVPHIFALQPVLYASKKPRHEMEKKLEELQWYAEFNGFASGDVYRFLVAEAAKSAREKGYFLVDFSDYFDDVSQWVFADWCHLTAGANYLLAKELANLIKEYLFKQPLTAADKIVHKDVFFPNLAAGAKVLYAPPADAPGNAPENMLLGHPGESLYSSRVVPTGERMEVALDLHEAHPISRLRVVWGDDASVPDEWLVEASVDGVAWTRLVQAKKEQTDEFSRWPGFEHYGAQPVTARYLRYRPLKTGKRVIRLRSWTVFR